MPRACSLERHRRSARWVCLSFLRVPEPPEGQKGLPMPSRAAPSDGDDSRRRAIERLKGEISLRSRTSGDVAAGPARQFRLTSQLATEGKTKQPGEGR